MAPKFKYPWLGIAIPLCIITFISTTSYFLVFKSIFTTNQTIWYFITAIMIYYSYYLAIYTLPGSPPKSYKPSPNKIIEWENYCQKCNNYKPPRSHHCKTCKTCVLMMDHHCPWTMNCVGYNNYPHFIRFLLWVIIGTGNLFIHQCSHFIHLYHIRHLPQTIASSPTKLHLITLILTALLNFFVLFTIILLFIRCIYNQIFNGRTQIESWEQDRIFALYKSKKLQPIIEKLTIKLFNQNYTKDINKLNYSELVNFPYDLNPFKNTITVLGPFYKWLYPWGSPTNGHGLIFEKNEFAAIEPNMVFQDAILCIPWPPDNNMKPIDGEDLNNNNNIQKLIVDGEEVIRKRTSINNTKNWVNDWGESLDDFGVDINA